MYKKYWVPLRFIFTLLLFAALGLPAGAFSFSPMVSEIDLDGSRPRIRYTVSNDTGSPVAIQVQALERNISIDGEESRVETDELEVFPSQLVLGAGERQEVVAEWTGDEIERERAFRVIAEQVAVDLDDEPEPQARIRMNMRYVASLYVRPEGATARPEVLEAQVVSREDDEGNETAYAEVLMENAGSAHVLLRDLEFEVIPPDGGDTEAVRLAGADHTNGSSVLIAGNERRIRIPLPQALESADSGTTLDLTVAE